VRTEELETAQFVEAYLDQKLSCDGNNFSLDVIEDISDKPWLPPRDQDLVEMASRDPYTGRAGTSPLIAKWWQVWRR
jgi:hypothetical protein